MLFIKRKQKSPTTQGTKNNTKKDYPSYSFGINRMLITT